jgi:outer membrane protein assembly factor BamB
MQGVSYRISGGNLEVLDAMDAVRWAGKPKGMRPTSLLPIQGSNDCIVLCDPGAQPRGFKNLFRVTPNGDVAWEADLPSSGEDFYLSVRYTNDVVLANTWSGFLVQLDLNTGRVARRTFVK